MESQGSGMTGTQRQFDVRASLGQVSIAAFGSNQLYTLAVANFRGQMCCARVCRKLWCIGM